MKSIIEAIYTHKENTPNKLCIVCKDRAINYNDFFMLIKRNARFLSEEYKIQSKDIVIAECIQSIEYFILEFSLHLLGAIFVPLEAKCTDNKIIDINKMCNSKLIVLKNKRKIESINNIIDYCEMSYQTTNEIENYIFPDTNSISEILFSTGTTGKEKGIVLTHKNDVAVAENIINGVSMKEDNVEIMPLPLNHSHGLRSCYANFLTGGTIVLLDSIANVGFLEESLNKYRVNSMDLVPAALTVLLKLTRNMLSNYKDQIRYVEFGSAALLEDDKKKIKELLPNSKLLNFYGSTESGRSIVYDFNSKKNKEKCIGQPTCNTELAIIDEDDNVIESSLENPGRIATAGDMNMLCYYKDEEETKKAVFGKYIVSNDLAYIDNEGDVILLGREDDVINIGGKKVSPEEIENIAKQIKEVEDCACIPVNDSRLGQAPKLFVQLRKGNTIDKKAIIDYLYNHMEKFKVPNQVEFIEKIPRTFNGKINRKLLK